MRENVSLDSRDLDGYFTSFAKRSFFSKSCGLLRHFAPHNDKKVRNYDLSRNDKSHLDSRQICI